MAGFAAALAGWSSGTDAGLVAAVRTAAQVVSFAAPLVLVGAAAMVFAGSARLPEIAVAQDATVGLVDALRAFGVAPPRWLLQLPSWMHAFPLALPAWGVVLQPLGLPLFLATALAVVRSAPFDLARTGGAIGDGSSEGVGRGLLALAERLAVVAIAALATTLYLGGGALPWLTTSSVIAALSPLVGGAVATFVCAALHVVAFVVKTVLMLVVIARVRAALPRLRPDQAMRLCWVTLTPLALLHLLACALLVLALGGGGRS